MKSIFDETAYNEIIDRVNQLQNSSKGLWGKMTVGQMLWHCQGPIAVSLGKQAIKKPSLIIGLLMKAFKSAMYNDKLWKQNIPTAKDYVANETKDFTLEKEKLGTLIQELYNDQQNAPWITHPVFGDFTAEQWGQLNYKHLDHHLRQFNC